MKNSGINKNFSNKEFSTSYSKKNEIKFISIGLASPEKIKKWAEKSLPNGKMIGKVLNANTLHYKTFKPQKGGLFCERIFGPLKDFFCACGKNSKLAISKKKKFKNSSYNSIIYLTQKEENHSTLSVASKESVVVFSTKKQLLQQQQPVFQKFCPDCEVEFTFALIRRYQLGYIELASPVTHVWYLKGQPNNISILLGIKKRPLLNMVYCSETITLENVLNKTQIERTPEELYSFWKKQTKFDESFSNLPSNLRKDSKSSNKYNKKRNQNSTSKSESLFPTFLKSNLYSRIQLTLKEHKRLLKEKKRKNFKKIKKIYSLKILLFYLKFWRMITFPMKEIKNKTQFQLIWLKNFQRIFNPFPINSYILRNTHISFQENSLYLSNKIFYSKIYKNFLFKKYAHFLNKKFPGNHSFKRNWYMTFKISYKFGELKLKKWCYQNYDLLDLTNYLKISKNWTLFSKKIKINNKTIKSSDTLRLTSLRSSLKKEFIFLDTKMFVDFKSTCHQFLKLIAIKNFMKIYPSNWFPSSRKLSYILSKKNSWYIFTNIPLYFLSKLESVKIKNFIEIWFPSFNLLTIYKNKNWFQFYKPKKTGKIIKIFKNFRKKKFFKIQKLNQILMSLAVSKKANISLERSSVSFSSASLLQKGKTTLAEEKQSLQLHSREATAEEAGIGSIFMKEKLTKKDNYFSHNNLFSFDKKLDWKDKSYKIIKNFISFFFSFYNRAKKGRKVKKSDLVMNKPVENNNYCFSYRERWFDIDKEDNKEWPNFQIYFNPENNLLNRPISMYKHRFNGVNNSNSQISWSKIQNNFANLILEKKINDLISNFLKLNQTTVIDLNNLSIEKDFYSSFWSGPAVVRHLLSEFNHVQLNFVEMHNRKRINQRKKTIFYLFNAFSSIEEGFQKSWNHLFNVYQLYRYNVSLILKTNSSKSNSKSIKMKEDKSEFVNPLKNKFEKLKPLGRFSSFSNSQPNYGSPISEAKIKGKTDHSFAMGSFQRLFSPEGKTNSPILQKAKGVLQLFLTKKQKKEELKRILFCPREKKTFLFSDLKKNRKKLKLIIRNQKLIKKLIKKSSDPKFMTLTSLPVLPPDLRPIVKMDGQIASSDLNRLYQRIIYRNDRLKDLFNNSVMRNSSLMHFGLRLVQEAVDNLISNGKSGVTPEKDSRDRLLKSLSDILKGKEGRFRQYLLGKRVDYSGRSVIVVGPTLKLHQCGIPKEMAFELFLPFLLKNILNQKLARTIGGAKNLIKNYPALAWELLQETMKTCPVLLNRAPTLHRLGIQAFQPKLIEGKAILLHPLVCSAFNADFDGDQMAVHIPLTIEARAEAWKLMLSVNNLLAPATGEPLAIPSQDMVLGCYYLTTNCNKKNIKYQKGSGLYFSNLIDVVKSYQNKKLDLHAIIWLKWNGFIENGTDQEEPIEIRLSCYGNYQEIYSKIQKNYNKENILINQYVSTTPGKVLFNFMIQKILTSFSNKLI
jgi:DNA-directed RNA polymerase beta' subunit